MVIHVQKKKNKQAELHYPQVYNHQKNTVLLLIIFSFSRNQTQSTILERTVCAVHGVLCRNVSLFFCFF